MCFTSDHVLYRMDFSSFHLARVQVSVFRHLVNFGPLSFAYPCCDPCTCISQYCFSNRHRDCYCVGRCWSQTWYKLHNDPVWHRGQRRDLLAISVIDRVMMRSGTLYKAQCLPHCILAHEATQTVKVYHCTNMTYSLL